MIEALNKKGYNAFSISVPTPDEMLTVIGLAAPVFVTMISKVAHYSILYMWSYLITWKYLILLIVQVAFYSLMIYFATSMGTHSVAAHQVDIVIVAVSVTFLFALALYQFKTDEPENLQFTPGHASNNGYVYSNGRASLTNCTIIYAWVDIWCKSKFGKGVFFSHCIFSTCNRFL